MEASNHVRPCIIDFLTAAAEAQPARSAQQETQPAAAPTQQQVQSATNHAQQQSLLTSCTAQRIFKPYSSWSFSLLHVLLAVPLICVSEKKAIEKTVIERLGCMLKAWDAQLCRKQNPTAGDLEAATAASRALTSDTPRPARACALQELLAALLQLCPVYGRLPPKRQLPTLLAHAGLKQRPFDAFLHQLLAVLDKPHITTNHLCCAVCGKTGSSRGRDKTPQCTLFSCSKCVVAMCQRCVLKQARYNGNLEGRLDAAALAATEAV